MKQTIYLDTFQEAFIKKHGGEYSDNFSLDGLNILFRYLNEASEEIELDVISICCNFRESNLDEFNNFSNKEYKSLKEASEHEYAIGITDDSIVYILY